MSEEHYNESDPFEGSRLRLINRRIAMKYPGINCTLTIEEVREAAKAAQGFLERQRGDGDTRHLNLSAGASVKMFPPQAHGKFCVEVLNGDKGTVTPMNAEFRSEYRKSKDPVYLEFTTSKYQDLRNERLNIPYERHGRLTLSGQYESITLKEQPDKQVVPSQQQEDIQINRRAAVCY